jgi:hypothetical protein
MGNKSLRVPVLHATRDVKDVDVEGEKRRFNSLNLVRRTFQKTLKCSGDRQWTRLPSNFIQIDVTLSSAHLFGGILHER